MSLKEKYTSAQFLKLKESRDGKTSINKFILFVAEGKLRDEWQENVYLGVSNTFNDCSHWKQLVLFPRELNYSLYKKKVHLSGKSWVKHTLHLSFNFLKGVQFENNNANIFYE